MILTMSHRFLVRLFCRQRQTCIYEQSEVIHETYYVKFDIFFLVPFLWSERFDHRSLLFGRPFRYATLKQYHYHSGNASCKVVLINLKSCSRFMRI